MTDYQPLAIHDQQPKPASLQTQAHQAQVRKQLPLSESKSFEKARRGFIASPCKYPINTPTEWFSTSPNVNS